MSKLQKNLAGVAVLLGILQLPIAVYVINGIIRNWRAHGLDQMCGHASPEELVAVILYFTSAFIIFELLVLVSLVRAVRFSHWLAMFAIIAPLPGVVTVILVHCNG